jgi:hypothetical protein
VRGRGRQAEELAEFQQPVALPRAEGGLEGGPERGAALLGGDQPAPVGQLLLVLLALQGVPRELLVGLFEARQPRPERIELAVDRPEALIDAVDAGSDETRGEGLELGLEHERGRTSRETAAGKGGVAWGAGGRGRGGDGVRKGGGAGR